MSARSCPDPAIEMTVTHPGTGIECSLLPAPRVYFSERRLQDLVHICNAPDILTMIREGGVPVGSRYTRRHANGFLKYALEGWEEQTHFVFFLLAPSSRESRIAGCIEWRSPTADAFETGYWVAPRYRGIGAKVLEALLEHARDRGVRLVWARVLETNMASRRMLSRVGFTLHPRFREPGTGGVILRYEKVLESHRRR